MDCKKNGGYLIHHIRLLNGRLYQKLLSKEPDALFRSEQEKILSILWNDTEGYITCSELSCRTGLANNTLTSMLKKLEEQGLEKIDTVEFKDVSFKYEGAEKAMLNNVDFTAKVGEKIAIIGSTGAGKSTLVNLLMRFLDTTTGELLMNGVNIREFTEKELREQIAFVPQNRMLFEGTIRDNLRFGNEHATDEEMIQALKQAEAWEFVSSLEEGLDAHVEQKGDNFSGGQKQRLSIARALVKHASIYVYDDSFSALDAKTEAKLRANLAEINQQSIIFVVAQRISSVTDATKIIVLHEGNVVGIGTHDELKESNQIYQEIMNSQSSLEEMEDTHE